MRVTTAAGHHTIVLAAWFIIVLRAPPPAPPPPPLPKDTLCLCSFAGVLKVAQVSLKVCAPETLDLLLQVHKVQLCTWPEDS